MQSAPASTLSPDLQRLVYDGYQFQLRNLFEDAARCYRKVLNRAPDNADVTHLLAMVRSRQGRTAEAIELYRLALARKPADAKIWYNLGLACAEAGRVVEAIEATARAAALEPSNGTFAGQLLSLRRSACDWTDHTRLIARVGQFAPFFSLWADDPVVQFNAARAAAGALRPVARSLAKRRPGPIRVGYLSADFRDHPVAHLISDLFGAHDRSKFEIVAFALGGGDATPYRQKIIDSVDRFVSCGNLDSPSIAHAVGAADIDILIDLMGHTTGHRMDLFAMRPAPVQVAFLGYPGTTGAAFIDYVIADPIVLPFDQAPFFSEAIVHLPGCYQSNARTLSVAPRPSRADYGLPDDAVVLCSMNNLNKLDPETFDIFCRILKATPGSVLWLLSRSEVANANLRKEAESRGVAPHRLVFARPVPLEQHLARLTLADLFLDSFPYTAHTTASDAVRMGLPLLTRTGRTFASRVAASVLKSAGLHELIADSAEAFEGISIGMASNPEMLRSLRSRVETAAKGAALFDIDRYARGIESAFATMLQRYEAGAPPSAFAVA